MTPAPIDDSCLYEPEAVRVGLILFPPRTCSGCGAVLPGNADYFAPDRSRGHLSSACRRCRRTAAKASYERGKVVAR